MTNAGIERKNVSEKWVSMHFVLIGAGAIYAESKANENINNNFSKEHTKNKSRAKKDKHEHVRSGQKKPPNYRPNPNKNNRPQDRE